MNFSSLSPLFWSHYLLPRVHAVYLNVTEFRRIASLASHRCEKSSAFYAQSSAIKIPRKIFIMGRYFLRTPLLHGSAGTALLRVTTFESNQAVAISLPPLARA